MPTTKPATDDLKAAWIAHRDAEEAWKAELRRIDPHGYIFRQREHWMRGEDESDLRTLWEAYRAARTRWEAIAGRINH